MVYTNFDFTPLLLPESRNTVKEKVPIIIRLPALYSVGVTGFEPATTRPPAVERIFVFISIGLEISDTIPCEWGDVLYLLRLSEMKSVIKM